MKTHPFISFADVMSQVYLVRMEEDTVPFVGHSESPWMPRLRAVLVPSRAVCVAFGCGLAMGAALDLAVRLAVG